MKKSKIPHSKPPAPKVNRRMYEQWASDVLGAYLLGSLTLVVIVQFYLWGKTRFFAHQPVSPSQPEPPAKPPGRLSNNWIRKSMENRRNKHVEEK